MRSAAAATVIGITLAIAGLASCTGPQDPAPPPEPDPSATPVFASDDEALAAAEELYGRYLKAENKLGKGGWKDVSLVEPFVRGDALDSEHDSANDLSANNYHQTGDIKFDSISLQQFSELGNGGVELTVYLCLDFTSAAVVDHENKPIEVGGRPLRVPLEVGIDNQERQLKIRSSEPWSGGSFC